jgi:hypothetical protein
MKEIDLIQAYYGAINLAYTAATWWLSISTALVVATYFAAKHIPGWMFVVTIILYAMTATTAVFEVMAYSNIALHYGGRIAATGSAWTVGGASAAIIGNLDGIANYVVFALGTISAAAYSFVTWRGARKTVASGVSEVPIGVVTTNPDLPPLTQPSAAG